MSKSILNVFFILTVFLSCSKDTTDSPQTGDITVVADESFENVTRVLKDRYMLFYPKTKINLKIKKENEALQDLLKGKARVIVMSRDLTANEKTAFKQKFNSDVEPARFAADGLVFIVSKGSAVENVSVDEIKRRLLDGKNSLIFDGSNSANTSFIAKRLGIAPNDLKYSTLASNEDIITQINKYPNSIGVVGFNALSRPHNTESKMFRESVKILPVVDAKGKSISISPQTMKNNTYPFTRVLYFITNEAYFGLGNGFIRFSCSQPGQIIVKKQGLQPFYIIPREVKITE
ncbi:PstS family phosphate ABC transporter substrate-binding protein [Chryseobacterium foetidum]|uniref:PstS family phosphate ABC transporter substrate-binding protein n=1 Tax=Chryseobacterium foetidum TaxID=2951057 RepID=UPI0021C8E9BD|nr:substrate-binding domain-containing protein [Chryseobacterium foetidum]